MARIRTIKPDFFMDTDLCDKPAIVRLFFIGLWTHADRKGRLADDPKKLKVQIIPHDPEAAEDCLAELDPKWIIRYEVKGRQYIQIVKFEAHQRPHPKEPESEIPSPTEAVKKNGKPCKKTAKQDKKTEGTPLREGVSLTGRSFFKGKGREGKEIVSSPSGSDRRPGIPASEKQVQTPEGYQQLVDHILTTYRARKGVPYPMNGIAGKVVKAALSCYGLLAAKASWDTFLETDWNWTAGDGRRVAVPCDLIVWQAKWTEIVEKQKFKVAYAEYQHLEPKNEEGAAAVSKLLAGAVKEIPAGRPQV